MTRRLAMSECPLSGASGARIQTVLIDSHAGPAAAVPVLYPLHALDGQVAQDQPQFVGGVPDDWPRLAKIGADDGRRLAGERAGGVHRAPAPRGASGAG